MSAFRMTTRLSKDVYFGGSLKIIEPVTVLNSPAKRRVRLLDQYTGAYVSQSWSDADTGDVLFDHLSAGPWVLYAIDHLGEYEAVAISDRIATVDGERP